jgi:Tol biopolymer transport system component
MSLPDGKHFLYLAIHHDPSKGMNNTLYYASLDGKENLPLLRSKSNAIYAAGYLLFARNDQMLAQPFNAANGKLTGEPQTVARGIMNDITTWHMDASASEQGLLVFGTGGLGDWQLVFVDRTSKQIVPVADKLNNLMLARLSPQGDRIALQIDTGTADVWVLDLARGVKTRLTFGPVQNVGPVWSPDGKWIAYSADRNGRSNICRKPADGAGAEELLVSEDQILLPNSWSRDGKYLIYQRGPLGNTDVWALPLEGDRKPRQILPNVPNAGTSMAEISPDGRWLAYMSSESGGLQVYVVAFDGGQGKWQISTNGGTQPHWSSDGKELFYLDPGYNIISVPVKEVGGALQFGAAQSIVNNWSAPQVFFDLTPDGKKILLDRISQQVSQSVTVVSNFTASLKN